MTEYELLYFKDKKIDQLIFDPKENITAHELSLLMPLIISNHWRTQKGLIEKYENLPDKCKKHFRVTYK